MTTEELQPFIDIASGEPFLVRKRLKDLLATITPVDPSEATTEPSEAIRTDQQRKAEHVWFRDVAKTCLEVGATVQDILKPTMDLQVDEGFIKWMFRRIGQKKYGKKSTAEHSKKEIDPIVDEMVKFFALKVDPPIELPPFPNDEARQRPTLEAMKVEKRLPSYPEDPYPDGPDFDHVDKSL